MMAELPGGQDATAARTTLQALRVAQEAAAQVPAYARFLRLAGYDAARLRAPADFQTLPITDKEGYLARFPLPQRCRAGLLPRAHMLTISSGTAGPSTLWPRFPEQDAALYAAVTRLLQEHFAVRERWTLIVLCTAMGAWGFATSMTQVCQRLFAEPRMRGSVVTPGLETADALGFVKTLSAEYDQTILVGYPALLVSLLARGREDGIDWAQLNTGVLASGEGMSEAQRLRLLHYLGRDPEELRSVVSAFGTSEVAGIIGFESRLCLLIRRLCARDPALCEVLFGSPVLPSLHQYNPLGAYLETHGEELLLTIRGAVPLVRFNTHDVGGLLSYAELLTHCRARGIDLAAELSARGHRPERERPWPFLYVFGRADAVIVHGGNLYFHEVRHVLEGPLLGASNTGQFDLAVETNPDGWVTLRLTVELAPGITPTAGLAGQYVAAAGDGLQQVSSRFRAAYTASQGKLSIDVRLVPNGTPLRADRQREQPPAASPSAPGPEPGASAP